MKKTVVLWSAVCSLFLLSACDTSQNETASQESTEQTTVTSQENKDILATGNWYKTNREALDQLILANGKKSSSYDAKNKPYAIFDWDNTSIINDVGEAVLNYQIENLRFKMAPAEFYDALKTDIPDEDFSDDWKNQTGETVNIEKVATDIQNSYEFLYDHYKEFDGDQSLDTVKKTDEYKEFSTKLRYLYDAIGDTFSPDISYPWVTYLFSGMTSEEVQKLSTEAIDKASKQELNDTTWTSPKDMDSEAGQIKITFHNGIRLVPEMQDLYTKLQNNGIDVYVVSASFIDVIIPFATNDKYKYKIPEENVYAMELEKKDNIIQAKYNDDYFQTQGTGKTKTIKKFIASEHNDQDPILVAGDSSGDVAMLSDFDNLQLGLIFNRVKDGEIGELSKKATENTDKSGKGYYLQGRDENKGQLINKQETILFGEKEAALLIGQ